MKQSTIEARRRAQRKYSKTEKGRATEKRHAVKRQARIKSLGRDKVYYLKRHSLKPEPCERCGDDKSQAHHEDYSKPLDVMWLCSQCHADRHKEIRDEEMVSSKSGLSWTPPRICELDTSCIGCPPSRLH